MVKWMSRLAVGCAVLQLVYGVLACAFPYPAITNRPFEAVWALINLGMIANIVVWLTLHVATPRLALFGGGLAILGHAVRVVVSLMIEANPDVDVDTPIAGTIMLMFVGLALLGIATLRARRLSGRSAWAPMFVLLAGLIAAPFYSFDKVVHFILLGILWGSAWLFMAVVGSREAAVNTPTSSTTTAAAVGEAVRS